jgi:hypothetical protein
VRLDKEEIMSDVKCGALPLNKNCKEETEVCEVFLDEATHLTPADYDRIAKRMMELGKALEEARQARELEGGSITMTLNVHDWIRDRSDALGYIGDALSSLLKDSSTGVFMVELRVPKVTPQ